MDFEQLKDVSKKMTPQGLAALGVVLRDSRLKLKTDTGRSFGLRRLGALIKERTGVSLHQSTLERLEKGRVRPTPDTIMAIAAAEYVTAPDGRPYSVEDLLKIASEELTVQTPRNPESDTPSD